MILVCGEALIDLFVGRANGVLSVEAVAGGSPFNVALGLGRLGRAVSYVGALSTDVFGEHLTAAFQANGVRVDHVRRLSAATTLSIVSTQDDGSVSYAFHGENCADRLMRRDWLPPRFDGVRCVTVGSYSLAVEPSGATYEAFAAAAAKAGCAVSFDPNVRPSLIGDWEGWRARFRRLLSDAAILKTSEEDIVQAFGPEARIGDLAAAWREAGPSLVVVTRGAAPALALGAFGAIEVPAKPTVFADAVGAGDSFHAGLLAALDRRDLLNRTALAGLSRENAGQVLGFAATAAAITCSRRGADLPYLAEIGEA